MAGLCDIELDLEGITVTTKRSKQQLEVFDRNTPGDIPFEVCGVEDYLRDYGNEQTVDQMKSAVMSSREKEFFSSFSMPMNSAGRSL